jgi:hypothetical protein
MMHSWQCQIAALLRRARIGDCGNSGRARGECEALHTSFCNRLPKFFLSRNLNALLSSQSAPIFPSSEVMLASGYLANKAPVWYQSWLQTSPYHSVLPAMTRRAS